MLALEKIPLEELGRPRIDVTVRISGFFRDAFPNLVAMLDEAVTMAAEAEDEPIEQNFVRQHYLRDRAARLAEGMNERRQPPLIAVSRLRQQTGHLWRRHVAPDGPAQLGDG